MKFSVILGFGLRRKNRRYWLVTLWAAIACSVCIWVPLQTPGWDVAVYAEAMQSLRSGHDPYEDAIQAQRLVYSQGPIPATTDPPFTYVYPPITLLLLSVLDHFSSIAAGCLYWSVYAAAILIQIWAGLLYAKAAEKRVLLYLAPVAMFFPGLLADGTVLSGNIAHILYAAMLVGAVLGWKRHRWGWFYAATLAAACVKPPLLLLVLIPALSSQKQRRPAFIAALSAVMLFGLQAVVCPSLFSHYLAATDLMFTLNRDFGCSPAGLFTQWLDARHLSYLSGLLFYFAYAVPLTALMFRLSQKYFAGDFCLKEWIPVLLLGVGLLNPRLIEYDVAPLTLPMALIAWRAARSCSSAKTAGMVLLCLFLIANAFGLAGWNAHKYTESPLLAILFAVGSWGLLRKGKTLIQTHEILDVSILQPTVPK